MIVAKGFLVIHPAWMLAFLFCYAFSFYVYFKTEDLFSSVASLALSMSGTAYAIHFYYGLV